MAKTVMLDNDSATMLDILKGRMLINQVKGGRTRVTDQTAIKLALETALDKYRGDADGRRKK